MLMLLAAMACTTEGTYDFTGGNFTITTIGVEDGCYEGALNTVFMPEGDDTPNDWANAIYLPGFDELPADVSVDLQEPFQDLDVTFEAGGEDELVVTDALQTAVQLQDDKDCVADLNANVSIVVLDADNVEGSVSLENSNITSPTDDCPLFDSDPCTITLDITGVRQ